MKENKNGSAVYADGKEAAHRAELIYVDEMTPGIRRRRQGRGFIYFDPSGTPVTDSQLISRIRSLVIPPAWSKVWIACAADGHIQATGRDTRGRKQYIYHMKWHETRNRTKFERLLTFGRALPLIRMQVEADLSAKNMTKRKAAAFVTKLLDITGMRIGNREYARMNQSRGLTTLLDEHLEVRGARIHFNYPGKGGKRRIFDFYDTRLAGLAKKFQDLPGQELIRYVNDKGEYQTVESGDVNEYLEEITGIDFTAKDFRTWNGTVNAAAELYKKGPAETKKAQSGNISQAIKKAAKELGNTPSICRKYYVHPTVIESYLKGDFFDHWENAGNRISENDSDLKREEQAVLRMLELGS
ncbi:MAG: hypothetical protein M0P57_03345 [Syntrophales bacterium]|nr:hypothetical protein [Syntrophales bacterium]MDY0045655.1 hypothetical protein [Syntrophales bacterium]